MADFSQEIKTVFQKTGDIHHAYGIVGESAEIVPPLLDFIAHDLGVAIVANPDFFHERFETFSVDDSRKIKERSASKPFGTDLRRVSILELHGITREAQNALLKLFEEPEPGNHFFLILPMADMLLPTLRSRLQIFYHVPAQHASGESGKVDRIARHSSIEAFLAGSLKERMAFVADLAGSVSDEKAVKYDAVRFLNDLEQYFYEKGDRRPALFEAIDRARSYLNDRAPSIKMLLEYVTLSL